MTQSPSKNKYESEVCWLLNKLWELGWKGFTEEETKRAISIRDNYPATPPPQGLADGDLGVYENFVAATSAAPQTDAVQKWEYKRVKGYAPHFQLESLGDDGWQLCAIDRDKTLDTEQVFYFKRPKQNK